MQVLRRRAGHRSANRTHQMGRRISLPRFVHCAWRCVSNSDLGQWRWTGDCLSGHSHITLPFFFRRATAIGFWQLGHLRRCLLDSSGQRSSLGRAGDRLVKREVVIVGLTDHSATDDLLLRSRRFRIHRRRIRSCHTSGCPAYERRLSVC